MSHHDMVLTPSGLRFRGKYLPCSIGRGGRSDNKREGDNATPSGVHRVVGALYRPDKMAAPCHWAVPIRPGYLWSDAPEAADYNQLVHAPYPFSHERLRRGDRLYDLVIILDWNWPNAIPGRGSAIFMHRWRRRGFPTEGCVAMAPDNLRWLIQRIKPGTRLLV